MEENNVLYQIKSLEKMIFRNCMKCRDKSMVNMPIPNSTQAQIIAYIIRHNEEEIYQKDLENILNLRRATVSGVLQTMEKNGLIQRIVDDEDSRAKKIILNKEVIKQIEENKKKMQSIERNITKGISEKDLEIFSKVINKMKENIGENN